jgi:hypothetical protein
VGIWKEGVRELSWNWRRPLLKGRGEKGRVEGVVGLGEERREREREREKGGVWGSEVWEWECLGGPAQRKILGGFFWACHRCFSFLFSFFFFG